MYRLIEFQSSSSRSQHALIALATLWSPPPHGHEHTPMVLSLYVQQMQPAQTAHYSASLFLLCACEGTGLTWHRKLLSVRLFIEHKRIHLDVGYTGQLWGGKVIAENI
jgi:hypothetical protein